MPSKTLEFHRQVANGAGGNVRMAIETVAEIMKYREALFRAAPSHQGGIVRICRRQNGYDAFLWDQ